MPLNVKHTGNVITGMGWMDFSDSLREGEEQHEIASMSIPKNPYTEWEYVAADNTIRERDTPLTEDERLELGGVKGDRKKAWLNKLDNLIVERLRDIELGVDTTEVTAKIAAVKVKIAALG